MSERIIGFVGYGAMAVPMSANLRNAGYDIIAYSPSGTAAGQKSTETVMAASPREVAEKADIVILCVPDDAAENQSLQGENGLLAGIKPGQLLLDTSTVSPAQADFLAQLAVKHHCDLIDCPMSGSTPEAERGELIMLAGGTEHAVERARPVLNAIGRLTIHTGPAGSAARLKLVVNGIMGATLNVIAEGVSYGLAEGIDRDTLFKALGELAVISPHHKRKLAMAQERFFPPQFPTRLMSKDMGLLLTAGRKVGAFMPGMAVADQALARSCRRHRDEDYAALIGFMEQSAANA